jgi:hypothetical protein
VAYDPLKLTEVHRLAMKNNKAIAALLSQMAVKVQTV